MLLLFLEFRLQQHFVCLLFFFLENQSSMYVRSSSFRNENDYQMLNEFIIKFFAFSNHYSVSQHFRMILMTFYNEIFVFLSVYFKKKNWKVLDKKYEFLLLLLSVLDKIFFQQNSNESYALTHGGCWTRKTF